LSGARVIVGGGVALGVESSLSDLWNVLAAPLVHACWGGARGSGRFHGGPGCRGRAGGPRHRIDGAVRVRGDLRGAPPPVLVQLRQQHRVQPLPVHDLPPTQTLRGGPHRGAPPPRPGSSSQRSTRPPGANTHLVDRVDRVDGRDRGPMVTGRRDQRRPPPPSVRAGRRSTAATSIGRPGAAPPVVQRGSGRADRAWAGRARSAVTVGVTCYSSPISGGRAGCGFRTTAG